MMRSARWRYEPAFWLLWSARTISFSGDVLAQVALIVLAARQANAALAVSLLLLAQAFAWLFGPLAGILADRSELRRLMLACELGQGLFVAAIAVATPPFAVTLALVAAMTLLATIFSPASKSALPALVHAEQLGDANALLRLGANVSRVAGPAIAGLLLAAAFGLPLVLLLDALSFALSALLLSRLPPLTPAPDARTEKPESIGVSLRAGLRYLLRHRIARAVTLALFLVTLFVALDNVGLVFLAERTLAGGPTGYGLALTGYGLGMVVAPLLLLRFAAKQRPALMLLAGIAIMGLGTALCGLAPALGAAVALQGVVGIGNGFENVAGDTLLQDGVAREMLGRVFGVAYAVPYAALLITYPAGGALLALTSARVVFVVAGVGTLAAGGVVAAMLGSSLPNPDRGEARPTPRERCGARGERRTRSSRRHAESAERRIRRGAWRAPAGRVTRLPRVRYDAIERPLAGPRGLAHPAHLAIHRGASSVPHTDATSQPARDAGEITDHIWERHVFVCTGGDWCPCVDGDGLGVHARFKALVKQYGLGGRVRVNHSGCLDQCGHGPMVVVYPEAVWYWRVRPDDVEEIVREHLIGGRPVERLRYRNHPGKNKLPRDENGRPIGRPERDD